MPLDLKLEEITGAGADTGHGNLLAVQPFMLPADYASPDRLCEKLGGYLDVARQSGWINFRTVAVFPEYIGAWLAAAGQGQSVYQAGSLQAAMRRIALRHLFPFIRAFFASREKDRVTGSLIRMLSPAMARSYQQVFSALARQYGITIVAGSILLTDPCVKDGVVIAGDGPIYNVSAVFRPDGRAYPRLACKAYPISIELPFVSPGRFDAINSVPAYETPAGRLGVLVCADSWYPRAYATMQDAGVDFLAVPSFITGDDQWEIPWDGYQGQLAPEDVDSGDMGRLTEGQAWRKYALASRLATSGAYAGANVFLHGALWDLGSNSGRSAVVNGNLPTETQARAAALLNLWL